MSCFCIVLLFVPVYVSHLCLNGLGMWIYYKKAPCCNAFYLLTRLVPNRIPKCNPFGIQINTFLNVDSFRKPLVPLGMFLVPYFNFLAPSLTSPGFHGISLRLLGTCLRIAPQIWGRVRLLTFCPGETFDSFWLKFNPKLANFPFVSKIQKNIPKIYKNDDIYQFWGPQNVGKRSF